METIRTTAVMLILISLGFLPCVCALVFERDKYHTHEEIRAKLVTLTTRYPHISLLYNILPVRSSRDRELLVMGIGLGVRAGKPDMRPHIKYIGNMHGNEIVNRELLLYLTEHLLTGYGRDEEITDLLNRTVIHVLPSMNPDGAAVALGGWIDCYGFRGRYNGANIDLNRNFPDFTSRNEVPRAKETIAVMNWMRHYPFVLSANFHGGALVANYPLDDFINSPLTRTSLTSDDDVFTFLARTYAENHSTMSRSPIPRRSVNGTINGAVWYPIRGGMQDYNYYHGTMELTIEAHVCKHDFPHKLDAYWRANKAAFLAYIKCVHNGVKGHVYYNRAPVQGAMVRVKGREEFIVRADRHGRYWRILTESGNYTLTVSAYGKFGHAFKEVDVTIPHGNVIELDIELEQSD